MSTNFEHFFAICIDVDECAVANGGCAQICTNSINSFTRSCREGYVLVENFDCQGNVFD